VQTGALRVVSVLLAHVGGESTWRFCEETAVAAFVAGLAQ